MPVMEQLYLNLYLYLPQIFLYSYFFEIAQMHVRSFLQIRALQVRLVATVCKLLLSVRRDVQNITAVCFFRLHWRHFLDWGSLWVPPSAALCTRYVPFKTHVAPAQSVATLKCPESTIGLTFQVGGYTTPFAVMGSALFLAAIMTAFVLPEHAEPEEDAQQRCKCLCHWCSDMRRLYKTLTDTLVSLALCDYG